MRPGTLTADRWVLETNGLLAPKNPPTGRIAAAFEAGLIEIAPAALATEMKARALARLPYTAWLTCSAANGLCGCRASKGMSAADLEQQYRIIRATLIDSVQTIMVTN